jgi:hypothetical protein
MWRQEDREPEASQLFERHSKERNMRRRHDRGKGNYEFEETCWSRVSDELSLLEEHVLETGRIISPTRWIEPVREYALRKKKKQREPRCRLVVSETDHRAPSLEMGHLKCMTLKLEALEAELTSIISLYSNRVSIFDNGIPFLQYGSILPEQQFNSFA